MTKNTVLIAVGSAVVAALIAVVICLLVFSRQTEKVIQQTVTSTLAGHEKAEAAAADMAALKAELEEGISRGAVEMAPGEFLKVDDYQVVDDGIINTYRRLGRVTIRNSSKYTLSNIRGEVEWVYEGGKVAGVVPFRLTRPVESGAQRSFRSDDGGMITTKLETSAGSARFRFTEATILEPIKGGSK